jgi:hypothetical protein
MERAANLIKLADLAFVFAIIELSRELIIKSTIKMVTKIIGRADIRPNL